MISPTCKEYYIALGCIRKPSGQLIGYILQNVNTAGTTHKNTDEIKQMLAFGAHIANLKLASDNRLVNTHFKGDLRGETRAICAYSIYCLRNFFGKEADFDFVSNTCEKVNSFRLSSINNYNYKKGKRAVKIKLMCFLAEKDSSVQALITLPTGLVVERFEAPLSDDGILEVIGKVKQLV